MVTATANHGPLSGAAAESFQARTAASVVRSTRRRRQGRQQHAREEADSQSERRRFVRLRFDALLNVA
jgi:hypothetical protein